jgi:hypothetical protein
MTFHKCFMSDGRNRGVKPSESVTEVAMSSATTFLWRGGRRSWRPRMTILLDFEGHGVGRLLGAAYVAAPRRERRRPRMGRG